MPLKPRSSSITETNNVKQPEKTGGACSRAACSRNKKPATRPQESKPKTAQVETDNGLIESEVKRSASPSNNKMPGTIAKGVRYSKAMLRWIKAGKPTRTEEQINELLVICKSCDFFNSEANACSKCGCNINSQVSGLKNKLAMATERCPDNPPRWVESV